MKPAFRSVLEARLKGSPGTAPKKAANSAPSSEKQSAANSRASTAQAPPAKAPSKAAQKPTAKAAIPSPVKPETNTESDVDEESADVCQVELKSVFR